MTATLQPADERKINRAFGRAKGRPQVSVVLLSDGCWQTVESSLARVAARCRGMHAEVIAIRSGDEPVPVALQSAHPEVHFCAAPVGTSEAQLRTIAMLEASGDIVALRRSADVRDALWLDAHFRVATGAEPDAFDAVERAVYDGAAEHAVVSAVSAELANATPASGSQWRASAATRHAVETSPTSGASSAA